MDNETQNSLPDELDELELGSVDSNSSSNTEDSVSIVMKTQPSKIVVEEDEDNYDPCYTCLLYTSPSPRDGLLSRMPSSA